VACFELVATGACNEGEGAVVRQGHLIAVVGIFLIGCAVLLVAVGCSGASSGASNKKEQGSSPGATVSKEEARCEGTRSIDLAEGASYGASASPASGGSYTTNDLPGCPNKGGLLKGTNKADKLAGQAGEDEVRGLGGSDDIYGGLGSDVIYGGPGADHNLYGGNGNDVIHAGPGDDGVASSSSGDGGDDVYYGGDGDDWIMNGMKGGKDVIYGGDGNDNILTHDDQPDKLYCGKGTDGYYADKLDYVDSSCEREMGANA
jgi:Ca2+-binding RTX toxin-like protein